MVILNQPRVLRQLPLGGGSENTMERSRLAARSYRASYCNCSNTLPIGPYLSYVIAQILTLSDISNQTTMFNQTLEILI